MAQKRVSVRLVAEGGRQVKAEFQGIGDAGERNFKRIERQADITGAVVRRVMGILGAAISTRQLVAYADQWTDLRSRVDLATGSQEAGAAVMERLAAMARRTYSSLGQTTESWLANATALRELGLTTAESLDFTEALNNAMVVSGARAERAASVQTALSRAMALGTLSGDNLNTVIQNGGRLAELLAAELGTTVSGLRRLGQEGGITGEVIRTALIGNLELLREEADSMPATIGDAFTLIGNAALQLVGTWDQMVGASETVAAALIGLADNMERLHRLRRLHGRALGCGVHCSAGRHDQPRGRADALARSDHPHRDRGSDRGCGRADILVRAAGARRGRVWQRALAAGRSCPRGLGAHEAWCRRHGPRDHGELGRYQGHHRRGAADLAASRGRFRERGAEHLPGGV
jgi:tape measure domain-containing protein